MPQGRLNTVFTLESCRQAAHCMNRWEAITCKHKKKRPEKKEETSLPSLK